MHSHESSRWRAQTHAKQHYRLQIGYFSQHTVDQLTYPSPQQLTNTYQSLVFISEGEARFHFGPCRIKRTSRFKTFGVVDSVIVFLWLL